MATLAMKEEATAYIKEQPTYHNDKASSYVLPNSSREHLRLEQQAAHLAAIMNQQLIHAPISQAQAKRVLDVGCGTGIVTKHLALKFPDAQVHGLDLSPVPHLGHEALPQNVSFYQGNILTEPPSKWRGETSLAADEGLFDLIFSRLLVLGMNDWTAYMQKEFSLLRPGGWAEVHDLDWVWYDAADKVVSDDWPWWRKMRAAMEAKGLDMACGSRVASRMEAAGFVDVHVTQYYWPFGGQPEHTPTYRAWGDWIPDAMIAMVHHMLPKVMGDTATPEEIEEMRQAVHQDFQPQPGKHWKMFVTVGRKP